MTSYYSVGLLACGLLLAACGDDDFERYQGNGSAGVGSVDPGTPEGSYGGPSFDPETHGEGPFVALGGDAQLEVFPAGEWFMAGAMHEFDHGNRPDDVFSDDLMYGIAPVARPHDAFLGLPELASELALRPSDGRLLYKPSDFTSLSELAVFHCDGCTQVISFPRMPRFGANDGVIETSCTGTFDYRLTAEGELVYACDRSIEMGPWVDEQGRELVGPTRRSMHVLCFGLQRTVLREDGVLDLETQAVSAFTGDLDPSFEITALATRAVSDGYWFVTKHEGARYHVSFDGVTTHEGLYPLPTDEAPSDADLDESGDLIVARGWVRRFSLSGEVEVLYEPPPLEELPRNLDGQVHTFSAFAIFSRPAP